ncbi:MAG: hypothetical protein V4579_04435 [Pseudomonadota bacterium]
MIALMVAARRRPALTREVFEDQWFESRAAMDAALNESRYLEIIRPDEDRFLDRDGFLSFVTRPLVQRELEG